ncbi:MAG: hypothetical protein HQ515_12080, partial [Phycisphaeraceae bacterium]|nr:hypothetical protein [Phycisphaeraceae bacterium]
MHDIIHVHTGEVKVGHCHEILQSTPIGSCIVVMAFDAPRQVGIMAHSMLPGRAPKAASMPTKYSVNAIEAIAENMAPHARLNDTGVCLMGRGNVLN